MLAERFVGSNKVINCECSRNYSTEQIQKYADNDLFVNADSIIKSVKSETWLKEGGYEEPSVASTDDISNETACYLAVL